MSLFRYDVIKTYHDGLSISSDLTLNITYVIIFHVFKHLWYITRYSEIFSLSIIEKSQINFVPLQITNSCTYHLTEVLTPLYNLRPENPTFSLLNCAVLQNANPFPIEDISVPKTFLFYFYVGTSINDVWFQRGGG